MFKNATIYRVKFPAGLSMAAIDSRMAEQPFVPCGPTQAQSSGWVPPRGEKHGAMVESVGGQWIARLMTEAKTVPGEALRLRLDARCEEIAASTGRKPGKKERKELTEEIRFNMLPHAFPKQLAVTVWIDAANDMMVLDTASQSVADAVVTELVRLIDGLQVSHLNTELSPATVMMTWLLDGDKLDTVDRQNFYIGRACELKASDDSKAVVRYKNHSLYIEEIRQHIQQGKTPVKLELEYDGRVKFTLTDGGVLAGIQFLDVVFEERFGSDGFDADAAIATGELGALIDDLIEALGGEASEGGAA